MKKNSAAWLESLVDGEVLFFIRRKGKEFYFRETYGGFFKNYFPNLKKYITISEYKKDADYVIDHYKITDEEITPQLHFECYEDLDVADVINRCRGLRTIGFREAELLVLKAYLYFNNLFKSLSLKLIVTGTIDNYVIDIMTRVGKKYDIVFLPITGSFLSPYYNLVSLRGEHNEWFEPTDELKGLIRNKLNESGKRNKNHKVYLNALRGAIKSYISKLYIYAVRHLICHKLLKKNEFDYKFALQSIGVGSLANFLAPMYFKNIRKLLNIEKHKLVYVPLHWYPEATTDYWVDSKFHSNYYRSLNWVVQLLTSNGYKVVVKEHPHFLFMRDVSIYKKLNDLGAMLVSPSLSTLDIFEYVDNIVLWNGSTGCEALFNGKKVYRVVNAYYDTQGIPDIYQFLDNEEYPEISIEKLVDSIAKTSVAANPH